MPSWVVLQLADSAFPTGGFAHAVVTGRDKVPRKGGPGITQSELLVINKTDLAPYVGADLAVMERDAKRMRGTGPTVLAQVTHGVGITEIVGHLAAARALALGRT